MRSNVLCSLLLVAFATLATACVTGRSGKLPVDSPAMTFQAADVDEITGIDPNPDTDADEPEESTTDPADAPSGGTAPASAPAGSH